MTFGVGLVKAHEPLALRLELLHEPELLLARNLRVDPVQLPEVDGVDAEPAQRGLAGGADVLRVAADAADVAGAAESDGGGGGPDEPSEAGSFGSLGSFGNAYSGAPVNSKYPMLPYASRVFSKPFRIFFSLNQSPSSILNIGRSASVFTVVLPEKSTLQTR